jgi:hypothetical protein
MDMLKAGVKPTLCSGFDSVLVFPSDSVNSAVAGAVSAMTFKFPSAEQFNATTLEPPHPGKIASNLPSVNIACDTEFARTRGVWVAILLSNLIQLTDYRYVAFAQTQATALLLDVSSARRRAIPSQECFNLRHRTFFFHFVPLFRYFETSGSVELR